MHSRRKRRVRPTLTSVIGRTVSERIVVVVAAATPMQMAIEAGEASELLLRKLQES